MKSVPLRSSVVIQVGRLVRKYRSPVLSWFLTLGLLAVIGWLDEYWLLLPYILQYIRRAYPHIGTASPSLAMVELPTQSFQTLDFLVPTFWQKHRACLQIAAELKVSKLTCLYSGVQWQAAIWNWSSEQQCIVTVALRSYQYTHLEGKADCLRRSNAKASQLLLFL